MQTIALFKYLPECLRADNQGCGGTCCVGEVVFILSLSRMYRGLKGNLSLCGGFACTHTPASSTLSVLVHLSQGCTTLVCQKTKCLAQDPLQFTPDLEKGSGYCKNEQDQIPLLVLTFLVEAVLGLCTHRYKFLSYWSPQKWPWGLHFAAPLSSTFN